MQKCCETMSTKLLGGWPTRKHHIHELNCLCLYGYRHFRIYLSATKLVVFQHLLLPHILMGRWRFCAVNTRLECWHFWQNWRFFKVSEALGRLFFMDYLSLYYGLYTIIANRAKVGETAGEMTTVSALHLCLPRVLVEGLRWRARRRQKLRRGRWWS